jgi:hypothetical protein
MGSTTEKYEHEIAALVDKWADASRELVPSFLTKALIDNHVGGLARANEHTPFFEHYTYRGVRDHVGKYLLKKYGMSDEDKKQKTFPGFEHLQTHYMVKRGEEIVPVEVDLISDDDLYANAKMLRRRGKACYAHADEIERFIEFRRDSKSA